jgi:hypothetical protein
MNGAPSGGGGGTQTPSWHPSGGRPGPLGHGVAAAHVIMQTLGPLFGSARHTHPAAPGGQRLAQSVSAKHGAGMGGGGHCGGGGSAHTPSLHSAAGAPGGACGGALQSVAAAHFTMHTLGPSLGSARQVQPMPDGQPLTQSVSLAHGGGMGGRHCGGGVGSAATAASSWVVVTVSVWVDVLLWSQATRNSATPRVSATAAKLVRVRVILTSSTIRRCLAEST